jgi:YVTN family beta-propeller protein
VLANDSLRKGNFWSTAAWDPGRSAFDSSTGLLYVPGYWSSNVAIVNTSTDQTVGYLPSPDGGNPASAVIDPVNHELYVANPTACVISVVNLTNDKVVTELADNYGPTGMAYDSLNGYLYVVHANVNNISVFNTTSNSLATRISLGPITGNNAQGIVLDPSNGYLYLAGFWSYAVTVINGATNKVVTSITVGPPGTDPSAIAYDSNNKDVYAANYYSHNVSIISTSTNKLVGSAGVGPLPGAIAVDNGNGLVYVADEGSNALSVINGSTQSVTGTIGVGSTPDWATYDHANGRIYVSNSRSDSLTAVDPTNGTRRVIPLGASPDALAYNPENGHLFVANYYSDNVTIVNASTDRVIGFAAVGGWPDGITYSNITNYVYVANSRSNNVTILNGTTGALVGWAGAGYYPEGIAYDPANGDVYVANAQATNVTVFNGTTGASVASIGIGANPFDVAVDPVNGRVFVGTGASNVTVIDGGNQTIIAHVQTGSWCGGEVYDDSDGDVYFAGASKVVIIDGINDSVVGTAAIGDPSGIFVGGSGESVYVTHSDTHNATAMNTTSGQVLGSISLESGPQGGVGAPEFGETFFADYYSGCLSILRARLPVVFAESGLAPGKSWSVTVNGTTITSSNSSIVFNESFGFGYAYSVGGVDQYTWSPSEGYFNVTTSSFTVNVTYVASPSHHLVSFNESGLMLGSIWSVTVNGSNLASTGTRIDFSEPNGTNYSYLVGSVTGFLPSPAGGLFNVSGVAINQSISFDRLYSITFSESGLIWATKWSITLNGTSLSSKQGDISFTETNGTYLFNVTNVTGYVVRPLSGLLKVLGGSVLENVTFWRLYSVTFREAGLPIGTNWSVSLNGSIESSTLASILFNETNGTYPYVVSNVSGYRLNPPNGSVTVFGSTVTQAVDFGEYFTVMFQEAGLPGGTNWSVALNGSRESSTMTTISFEETNGTYHFTVSEVSGYQLNPENGSITVSGSAVTQSVGFGEDFRVAFQETGLPGGTNWSVTLNGTTVAGTASSLSFAELNGSYKYSIGAVSGYAVGSTNGTLKVSGNDVNESVVFHKLFAVMFKETGLRGGVNWSVVFNGTKLSSKSNTVSTTVENGSYSYVVGEVQGYQLETPGNGTAIVNGASVDVSVQFAALFWLTLSESGLSSSTYWSVLLTGSNFTPTILGSTNNSMRILLPNGSYSVTVFNLSGFFVTPTQVNFSIAGTPATFQFEFSELYTLTFSETGLPSGTSWAVTLGTELTNRTTSGSLTFTVTSGVYSFTVAPVPGYSTLWSGSASVEGHNLVVNVAFSVFTWTVRFSEQGLSVGTPWGASIGSLRVSGTGSTLSILVPNGTYEYVVSPVSGYTTAWTGQVRVDGSSVWVNLSFVLVTYTVTIRESGLPTGTSWTVEVGSSSQTMSTTSTEFDEPNGTYAYTVTPIPGYSTRWTGVVSVDGGSAEIDLAFVQVTYALTFSESGLTPGTPWSVIVDGVSQTSTSPTLVFEEPNGTYSYSIGAVTGFSAVEPGNVTVAGGSQTVPLAFSPLPGAPNHPLSPPVMLVYAAVGAGIAIVALAALLVLLRKRRGRSSGANGTPSDESADPATQAEPPG